MSALPQCTPPASSQASPPGSTDEQLMAMIQSRDSLGLALLYTRYVSFLKAMSMKVLYNEADAEDLVQEVFLEIWNRAANYDPMKGRPLSWIGTLTRRRGIDRLRKRETCSRATDRFALEKESHSSAWSHVHEDLLQSELQEHVQRALATLPPPQRQAIQLAYQGGMSQREIAAHTGIPLGTIKTRLELGLRKLAVNLYSFRDLLETEEPVEARNITGRFTTTS